ncbi:putative solute carrier family 35 member f1 protein [Podospora conica]|nr:putative solute carrier family 35 member f1 protein [Schizothecium conicum]
MPDTTTTTPPTPTPADSKAPDDGYGTTTTTPAETASLSESDAVKAGLEHLESRNVHWYSYLGTLDFWAIIAVGQVLSLCITASNTFSTFLAAAGTSIPAFQTIFNYVLLTLLYLPWTVHRLGGPLPFLRLVRRDGWKYLILSLLDVEGNYFTVLAYRYTNILSAQLLNFWSIVCVVAVSFFLLRVRYRPFQIAGVLLCCAGMGLLLASDHLTGSNGGPAPDLVKGDLFGLAGATFYGLSNVFEEWFVSRRPAPEVLAFLGLFGVLINGVQAAIFDRASFAAAAWTPAVGGYLAGYTLALTLFYSLVPIMLRMGSAAVFDVSLLTANFWGVIIGIRVFGYVIHFLYPIAFVLIILGLVVYFLAGSILGDSKKPWLGDGQAEGVAGFGTAKLKEGRRRKEERRRRKEERRRRKGGGSSGGG